MSKEAEFCLKQSAKSQKYKGLRQTPSVPDTRSDRQPLTGSVILLAQPAEYSYSHSAVASLGWVTPGAATEGLTPLFFS